MTVIYQAEAYNTVNFEISRGEDWRDALPRVEDIETGAAVDLTGMVMRIYIRPTFGYADSIMVLSSDAGTIFLGDQTIDAEKGRAAVDVDRAAVISSIPAGRWSIFNVLTDPATDPDLEVEQWRGEILVLPDKISG